jgi:hypothetical protein
VDSSMEGEVKVCFIFSYSFCIVNLTFSFSLLVYLCCVF